MILEDGIKGFVHWRAHFTIAECNLTSNRTSRFGGAIRIGHDPLFREPGAPWAPPWKPWGPSMGDPIRLKVGRFGSKWLILRSAMITTDVAIFCAIEAHSGQICPNSQLFIVWSMPSSISMFTKKTVTAAQGRMKSCELGQSCRRAQRALGPKGPLGPS